MPMRYPYANNNGVEYPDDERRPQTLKMFSLGLTLQLIGGGTAGAVSKTVIAPLERVKILLQTGKGRKYTDLYPGDPVRGGNTSFEVAHRIIHEQGFLALWRGNGAQICRVFPVTAIKFSCYDQIKALTMPNGEQGYPWMEGFARKAAAGATAAVVVDVFTYPLTVCFTRLTADMARQGQVKEFAGLWDCIRKTRTTEGVQGLYRGMGISLCGIVPFYAISFPLNDVFKGYIGQLPFFKDSATATKLVAGGVAAICTMCIVYPTDTIRRRLAVSGTKGERRFDGTLDCIRCMYQEAGIRGFYKGISLNALKVGPQMAVQFMVYDWVKDFVNESVLVTEYALPKLK